MLSEELYKTAMSNHVLYPFIRGLHLTYFCTKHGSIPFTISVVEMTAETDFTFFSHLLQLAGKNIFESNPIVPCLVQNYVRLQPLIKHRIYLLEVYISHSSALNMFSVGSIQN